MPKTNHEFIAGQNSLPGHSNPFPRDSGAARAWDLGRRTPKPVLPTRADGDARVAKLGLQAHNAKALALGLLGQL